MLFLASWVTLVLVVCKRSVVVGEALQPLVGIPIRIIALVRVAETRESFTAKYRLPGVQNPEMPWLERYQIGKRYRSRRDRMKDVGDVAIRDVLRYLLRV